jgi:hypothetical protein
VIGGEGRWDHIPRTPFSYGGLKLPKTDKACSMLNEWTLTLVYPTTQFESWTKESLRTIIFDMYGIAICDGCQSFIPMDQVAYHTCAEGTQFIIATESEQAAKKLAAMSEKHQSMEDGDESDQWQEFAKTTTMWTKRR